MNSRTVKPLTLILSEETRKSLEELARRARAGKIDLVKMMTELALEHLHLLTQTKTGIERILPRYPSEGSPAVLHTEPSTVPSLVKPAVGFNIGVFGELVAAAGIIDVASVLSSFAGKILRSTEDLSRLTPGQLEELVLDRLVAMEYEAFRAGNTFQADSGIDIVFKSKPGRQFPIMGAVQVKHRINPAQPIGPQVVRELAGTISQQFHGQFNMAMVVTNTFFTQAAQNFIKSPQVFLRLKDGNDLMRWVRGDFGTSEEFRGFPNEMELTTKLILELNKTKLK